MFGTTHPTGRVPFVPAAAQYGPLGYALVTAPPSPPLEEEPAPEPLLLDPVPLDPVPLEPAPLDPVPLDPAPLELVPLDPVGVPPLDPDPLPPLVEPLLDVLPPLDPPPLPELPLPEQAESAVDAAMSVASESNDTVRA
jgi:hypothetical protein